MNKLKRCIALGCSLLFLSVPCKGANVPPNFRVSTTDDSVVVGDSVYLMVEIENNKGFGALQFCIDYDEDLLMPESDTLGEIISEGAITSINSEIVGEINFSVISLESIEENGAVLVSRFKAIDTGVCEFDFKLLAYADCDGVSLEATDNDVKILVKADEAEADFVFEDDFDEEFVFEEETEEPTEEDAEEKKSNKTDAGDAEKDKPLQKEETKKVSFLDVSEDYWAYNQIYKVTQRGLFGGTGDGYFSPDEPMTRAMFVTVLHRYAGSPEAGKADFKDVGDSWYTKAVAWAAENSIVTGTGEGYFSPDANITRGEMATILCRYKNGKSVDINSAASFKDGDLIPEWGKEAISWAVENGIITGRSGGIVAFSDNATRAEAAVIFARFMNVK